jgi:hypothetical protein
VAWVREEANGGLIQTVREEANGGPIQTVREEDGTQEELVGGWVGVNRYLGKRRTGDEDESLSCPSISICRLPLLALVSACLLCSFACYLSAL